MELNLPNTLTIRPGKTRVSNNLRRRQSVSSASYNSDADSLTSEKSKRRRSSRISSSKRKRVKTNHDQDQTLPKHHGLNRFFRLSVAKPFHLLQESINPRPNEIKSRKKSTGNPTVKLEKPLSLIRRSYYVLGELGSELGVLKKAKLIWDLTKSDPEWDIQELKDSQAQIAYFSTAPKEEPQKENWSRLPWYSAKFPKQLHESIADSSNPYFPRKDLSLDRVTMRDTTKEFIREGCEPPEAAEPLIELLERDAENLLRAKQNGNMTNRKKLFYARKLRGKDLPKNRRQMLGEWALFIDEHFNREADTWRDGVNADAYSGSALFTKEERNFHKRLHTKHYKSVAMDFDTEQGKVRIAPLGTHSEIACANTPAIIRANPNKPSGYESIYSPKRHTSDFLGYTAFYDNGAIELPLATIALTRQARPRKEAQAPYQDDYKLEEWVARYNIDSPRIKSERTSPEAFQNNEQSDSLSEHVNQNNPLLDDRGRHSSLQDPGAGMSDSAQTPDRKIGRPALRSESLNRLQQDYIDRHDAGESVFSLNQQPFYYRNRDRDEKGQPINETGLSEPCKIGGQALRGTLHPDKLILRTNHVGVVVKPNTSLERLELTYQKDREDGQEHLQTKMYPFSNREREANGNPIEGTGLRTPGTISGWFIKKGLTDKGIIFPSLKLQESLERLQDLFVDKSQRVSQSMLNEEPFFFQNRQRDPNGNPIEGTGFLKPHKVKGQIIRKSLPANKPFSPLGSHGGHVNPNTSLERLEAAYREDRATGKTVRELNKKPYPFWNRKRDENGDPIEGTGSSKPLTTTGKTLLKGLKNEGEF